MIKNNKNNIYSFDLYINTSNLSYIAGFVTIQYNKLPSYDDILSYLLEHHEKYFPSCITDMCIVQQARVKLPALKGTVNDNSIYYTVSNIKKL